MLRISRLILLSALMLLSAALPGSAAQKNGISKKTAPPKVDNSAVKDSALIMADDYAVALAEKPELASVRLNAFKRFYDRQPEAVRDTVSTVVFNCMADYVEQGKSDRADAFKQCFLKVAKDNDPNLGPLYAMQMATAKERFDTAAVIRDIALLDDYARRMNVDYDSELDDARAWIYNIRTRKPIRDAIVGVWVSEDVAGVNIPGRGEFMNFPEDFPLINTTKVLQIRDTNHPIYRDEVIRGKYKGNDLYVSLDSVNSKRNSEIRNLDVIKCRENLCDITPVASTPWYVPLETWELPGFGMEPLDSAYIAETPLKGTLKFGKIKDHTKEHLSRFTMIDEQSYSLYAFWGDERLKRNNAEVGAILRQTSQSMQASIAGELAKSTYSFSDALAGNLLAGMGGALISGIVDALMVSKETIWSIETTLHMVNPNELVANTYAQLITAKSDNPKPEVKQYQHQTRYYRWEPKDSVVLAGTYYTEGFTPWNYHGGIIALHDLTKKDKEKWKKYMEKYRDKWKAWYENLIDEQNNKIKALKKGSPERKEAETYLTSLKRNPPQIYMGWNKSVIERLKSKSMSE